MNNTLPFYEKLPSVQVITAEMLQRKFTNYPLNMMRDVVIPCAEVAHSILLRVTRPPEPQTVSRCGDCGAHIRAHYKYCPGCGIKISWVLHQRKEAQSKKHELNTV